MPPRACIPSQKKQKQQQQQQIGDQQIYKKSILHSWYTQIRISHAHGTNQKPKFSSVDGHTAEIAKFNQ